MRLSGRPGPGMDRTPSVGGNSLTLYSSAAFRTCLHMIRPVAVLPGLTVPLIVLGTNPQTDSCCTRY